MYNIVLTPKNRVQKYKYMVFVKDLVIVVWVKTRKEKKTSKEKEGQNRLFVEDKCDNDAHSALWQQWSSMAQWNHKIRILFGH